MSRIFISGVAGFLGSHLADAFIADGHTVVGIDNMSGGERDNVPAGCIFHEVDCNDTAAVRRCMAECEVVYHCAARAYEGLSVFSPHLVTQSIVTASTGMISAAVAAGARRFVMCSSMARYGSNAAPFTEDMAPLPQDPYGIGKVAAEMLLVNLAETHGMEWVIAVPHNIIGPRQRYDDPYRNVASIFINGMLQGQRPYVYGDGNQRRCFTFVADAIAPLRQMAFDPVCNQEIINIGPDTELVTVNRVAELVAELLRVDLPPIRVPARPQEVYLATCCADKARRLLAYEPKVGLEDGLRTIIDWIRLRGPRPFRYDIELEITKPNTPRTWTERLLNVDPAHLLSA